MLFCSALFCSQLWLSCVCACFLIVWWAIALIEILVAGFPNGCSDSPSPICLFVAFCIQNRFSSQLFFPPLRTLNLKKVVDCLRLKSSLSTLESKYIKERCTRFSCESWYNILDHGGLLLVGEKRKSSFFFPHSLKRGWNTAWDTTVLRTLIRRFYFPMRRRRKLFLLCTYSACWELYKIDDLISHEDFQAVFCTL